MQGGNNDPLGSEGDTANLGPSPSLLVEWEPVLPGRDLVLGRLAGVFDFTCVDAFNRQVDALLGQGIRGVVLVLHDLEFIDSGGLGALLRTARRFYSVGGAVTICCPSVHVESLFKLIRLQTVVPFAASEDDALSLLRAGRPAAGMAKPPSALSDGQGGPVPHPGRQP